MQHDWQDQTPPWAGVAASWAAVFRDIRALATDLTLAGTEMARQVPVPPIDQLATGWSRIEEAVLREVKGRLDQLDAGARPPGAHRAGAPRPTPAQLLDELLTASIEADSASSREELYRSLLSQLVPDEARILAALVDGTPYPLVHVQSRAPGGLTVLANASTIGRAAGVQIPDAVTFYVGHLRALGLAEEGPADDALGVQYDILLGEPAVRRAEDEAKAHGRLGARVVRRTLRISPLGQELWRACRPEDLPEPGPESLASSEELDADGVAPVMVPPVPGPNWRPDTAYRPDPAAAEPTGNGRGQRRARRSTRNERRRTADTAAHPVEHTGDGQPAEGWRPEGAGAARPGPSPASEASPAGSAGGPR